MPKIKPDTETKETPKRNRSYKNRPLALTEKVLVRLDHKTQIYTTKPYDIEALRQKYLVRSITKIGGKEKISRKRKSNS
jgi:hypothetical protein